VRVFDFLGFFLRADGGDYAVAVREEDVENVGCDEAAAALVRLVFRSL
jgi:hypothetical protein